MKKAIRFMLVAAAATALLSCAKEITTDNASELAGIPMKEYTFQAGVDTRAALGNDGLTVVWESTDKLTVFCKYVDQADTVFTNAEASVVSSEGKSATFSVTLPETVILDTLYALYTKPVDGKSPFTWRIHKTTPDKYYKDGITGARVEFPGVQTAVKGSFDKKAAPMISRWINSGDGTPSFSFSNLSGLLKLEVDNQSSNIIDSIVFKNSSNIIGKYYWGFKHSSGQATMSSSTNHTSVSLTGPFEGKGTYYFVLPFSSTSYEGITLSFYSQGKKKTFSNGTSLKVSKNHIYPLGSFTVTDEWFPVDEGFSIACQERTKADRDTTYSVAVSAKPGLEWTASVTGEGATVEPASGTGAGFVTVKVPVNCNTTEAGDLKYDVTVATEDASIEEASRSQSITLTQKHETKVLFGTKWGASFIKGWNNKGFVKETPYTAEYVTVQASNTLGQPTSSTSAYIRGNPSFSFKAGETGTGTISFRARVKGAKKPLVVKRGDDTVYSFKSPDDKNFDSTDDYTVTFDVEKDDVITISLSSSGDHYLYCNDKYPISWTGIPAPAATVSSVSCAVDEGY